MKKNYDNWRREQGTPEPFIIGGQEFTPRPKLPWEKFGRLIMAMDTEDEEEGMQRMYEFFDFVLIKSHRARFAALLKSDGEDQDDDDACVDMAQVQELVKDLMEKYTGKALTSEETSSPGPSKTGKPLNVVSLTPHAQVG